jgi:hypothetical protein
MTADAPIADLRRAFSPQNPPPQILRAPLQAPASGSAERLIGPFILCEVQNTAHLARIPPSLVGDVLSKPNLHPVAPRLKS